ncbi:MAG: GPW/gp25 family protein [Anaerolineales bacterium]|nr:GPW/gp25 family protein [Anaerolineales bacterium]
MDSNKHSFLGSGWHWPLAVDSQGGIALVHEADDIYEAITNILMTAPGERVMRPEYGCGIHDLIFAPINANTFGRIVREVEEALGRWEPRAEVLEVNVNIDPDTDSRILIQVSYRIKTTHDKRSLVYPFYLIPEE